MKGSQWRGLAAQRRKERAGRAGQGRAGPVKTYVISHAFTWRHFIALLMAQYNLIAPIMLHCVCSVQYGFLKVHSVKLQRGALQLET